MQWRGLFVPTRLPTGSLPSVSRLFLRRRRGSFPAHGQCDALLGGRWAGPRDGAGRHVDVAAQQGVSQRADEHAGATRGDGAAAWVRSPSVVTSTSSASRPRRLWISSATVPDGGGQ